MDFLVYELTAVALHLGERPKGNLLKPCLRTIPYSAISGALNRQFGLDSGTETLKAVGFLDSRPDHNRRETLIYSPRDRVQGISKIPLQVEYLADVKATVLVIANPAASQLPEQFEIALGGMRSHGFGAARLTLREKRSSPVRPQPGPLRVRLPEEEATSFGIVNVLAPVYGYLFKPTPGTLTGVYVRSLFEGSRVAGPDLLLEPKNPSRDR